MRWIFALVAVACLAMPCHAELNEVSWDGRSLYMNWSHESDWIRLAQDDQGYLTLQSEPGSFDLGPRIVSDTNSLIPAADIENSFFHLSGGDDQFVGTSFEVTGEVWIVGGPGDDEIRMPYAEEGVQIWAWGNDGDDIINAYDSYETYAFGGDGDDQLLGGYQGYHYRDAGPGLNQIIYGARYGETDIVYHPGSDVSTVEIYAAPTNYFLAPGDVSRVGNLSIYDPYRSHLDTLTLNGHDFNVVNGTIMADWVTGTWNSFDGVTITDGTMSTSTPEPATWLLAVVAALMGWGMTRRSD